jgi:hypothetical protein
MLLASCVVRRFNFTMRFQCFVVHPYKCERVVNGMYKLYVYKFEAKIFKQKFIYVSCLICISNNISMKSKYLNIE